MNSTRTGVGPFGIGIDLGTSALKAVLFDSALRPLEIATRALKTRIDDSGASTQDFRTVVRAATSALAELAAHRLTRRIRCVGITTHRSSLVAVDPASHRAVSPLVLWNDRRAAPLIARMSKRGLTRAIARRTALPVLPFFFGPRAAALRSLGAIDSRSRLLTADAALLCALGAEDATTDPSYSSRTLLAGTHGDYDAALLRAFGVSREQLARVVPSTGPRGTLRGRTIPPTLRGLPVTAALADQSAAYLGLAGFDPARTTLTIGTGTFAARGGARHDRERGVFPLFLARTHDASYLGAETNDPSTGASFRMVRELVGVADDDTLERMAKRSRSAVFVAPAATGLGAPWLQPTAEAAIFGLSDASTPSDIARGLFEGVAARIAELLQLLGGTDRVRAGGGGAKSDLLLQLAADRSGRTIERTGEIEVGALGAAGLARIGAGETWESIARLAAARTRARKVFVPTSTASSRERARREAATYFAIVAARAADNSS